MSTIDQLVTKVRTEAARRGIRPATLARLSGLSLNTLRGMYGSDWNPRIETLRKIEATLDQEKVA